MNKLNEQQLNVSNIENIESGMETLLNVIQYVKKDLKSLSFTNLNNERYKELLINNLNEISSLLDYNFSLLSDMIDCNKKNDFTEMGNLLSAACKK